MIDDETMLLVEDPIAAELRARIESVREPISVVHKVEGGYVVGQLGVAQIPVDNIHRMQKPSTATAMNRRARRAQASKARRG